MKVVHAVTGTVRGRRDEPMSTTEIYGVKDNGDVVKVGETDQALRGAMFIWTQLGKRYNAGGIMDFSPLWALQDSPQMEANHSLVLKTTFDGAVVMKDEIPKVLAAFSAFDAEFPGSSLPKQADIIERKILHNDDMMGVCWSQTSSLAHAWEVQDDETDAYIPYNVNEQTEHWVV